MTLSPSFFSSKVNPYWNPEQPPPWMKTRRGLFSESGIVLAKYFTFSMAASLSVRSGPASVIGVGVLGSMVVDIEVFSLISLPGAIISDRQKARFWLRRRAFW